MPKTILEHTTMEAVNFNLSNHFLVVSIAIHLRLIKRDFCLAIDPWFILKSVQVRALLSCLIFTSLTLFL